MQLQLIIGNGEKGHHTLVLNDGDLFQSCYCHVCNGTSLGVNVGAFYLFLGLWSFFALLQPCGQMEGGIILGVMPITLVPYTPSLSKFVESP
jgi:hypothetical protein